MHSHLHGITSYVRGMYCIKHSSSFGGAAGMRLEWVTVLSAMELDSGHQMTFRRSWRSSGNETKKFVHTSFVLI